jgi:hypothetical protein
MKRMLRCTRRPFGVLAGTLVALALSAATAQAAITFSGSPGTGAPPSTLGPYTMTAFGPDSQATGVNVTGVTSPLGGTLAFSPALYHVLATSAGWATWSNGYTGDVYTPGPYSGTSATLTLPSGTAAFYFYAEPNPFLTYTITATEGSGTTSGPVSVYGEAGAKYYGFYATGGSTIATISITTSIGFAIGEFGIERGAPTVLTAAPQLVEYEPFVGIGSGVVQATLTSGGSPVAGQTIYFTDGSTALCQANTNASGIARCSISAADQSILYRNNTYSASYSGIVGTYLPSSATTPVVTFF